MSYAGPAKSSGRPQTPVRRLPVGTRSSVDDSEKHTELIVGLAIGAVLGAGMALLFAPRSGRSTRRRIARAGHRFTDEVGDRGRDAWSDLRREFRHALEARRERRLERQRKSLSLRDASSL